MKRQGNEEFGQDLGESKVQNTLDGMVHIHKKVRRLTREYAHRDARRARCLPYSRAFPARHISLVKHQVAI